MAAEAPAKTEFTEATSIDYYFDSYSHFGAWLGRGGRNQDGLRVVANRQRPWGGLPLRRTGFLADLPALRLCVCLRVLCRHP